MNLDNNKFDIKAIREILRARKRRAEDELRMNVTPATPSTPAKARTRIRTEVGWIKTSSDYLVRIKRHFLRETRVRTHRRRSPLVKAVCIPD